VFLCPSDLPICSYWMLCACSCIRSKIRSRPVPRSSPASPGLCEHSSCLDRRYCYWRFIYFEPVCLHILNPNLRVVRLFLNVADRSCLENYLGDPSPQFAVYDNLRVAFCAVHIHVPSLDAEQHRHRLRFPARINFRQTLSL
jgi:hypothetical protein